MTIFFRSLRAQHIRKGESKELMRLPGNDWNTLREYSQEDDARNIFWRKSTGERIYTKDRMDSWSFSLYTIFHENLGDNFCSKNNPISRSEFYHTIEKRISQSAKAGWHGYKELSSSKDFLLLKPKKSLIFIASNSAETSLLQEIQTLAWYNDVIFLHVSHPFEVDGWEDILFDGKKLCTDLYKKESEANQKKLQSSIVNVWASYIAIKTNEDFEKRINHFFKHRFQYG